MKQLKLLAMLLPIFLMIDLLWLGVVMNEFYSRELGDLVRREGASMAPRWGAALLVYLLIPGGLVLFVRPLFKPGDPLSRSFFWGAVFGGVLYGVYDLTNLAILEKWTVSMTIADILWGCLLCGTMSLIMHMIVRYQQNSAGAAG
jgi:uncharacterized membrane protein